MDRYNKMNNTWYFEKNVSVNVCGEQGLPAWGVCNLGSINLASFVENGEFNFEKYDEVIKTAVRFLDDAIDTEKYLYREIEETQERERRQGLGTMGLADALIKMKIRYGSEESLRLIDKIYEQLRDTAYNTSIELAKEKGGFPMFEAKKYLQSGFIRTLPSEITSKIKKYGIRNALILTEAPTGKISMLAGVSSGIEPIFSFSYIQTDRLGERTVFHPVYQEWIDQNGKDTIPSYFVVADDLTPEEHIKVQALIQKYTDSSISKTVNAPKTHTIEDVEKLYQLAYESGCKGISYMRDGSREGTLIRQESKDKKEESNEKVVEINKPVIWERPTKVIGATYRLKTPVGTAFITVNHDELGSPVELFINIGRAGSDVQAMAEALGRLISKSLRSSDHLSTRERAVLVIEQLMGIGGARTVGFGQTKIFSLPDAVAKALAMDMGLLHNREETVSENGNGISNGLNNHLETNSHSEQLSIDVSSHDHSQLHFLSPRADICPQCGNATLVHEMGCKTCHSCGYSEC
jgi:ribonucleoside-diphosphate reductase alpha chain